MSEEKAKTVRILCRYSKGLQCKFHCPKFNLHECTDVLPGMGKPCVLFEPKAENVYNQSCAHVYEPLVQFEGDYKIYEIDEHSWTMTIGKKTISMHDVRKLVIDGRDVEFEFDPDGELSKIIWR